MTEELPLLERCGRAALLAVQAERLTRLLSAVYGRNVFYTRKFDEAGIRIDRLRFPQDLTRLPLTTKQELVADQAAHPPWGTALTEPISCYTRYHQTSSTTGRPLRWLDTQASWQRLLGCWRTVYRSARVTAEDRILFAFSFGPFLGFWTAFEAATQLGAHCVPAGGMSSDQRLALIAAVRPTVVCCTPTYALRMAEVARHDGTRELKDAGVRVLIVAGEPGGSIPATRQRIEQEWGARVIDHHGMTEVGPVSVECWERPGALHVNEPEYICEVVDPTTLDAVPDRETGELVLTTLGRIASPVIRYRTGDIVARSSEPCACGRTLSTLEGGIIGRTDDMVMVRGVNLYPAAVESVIRCFAEVAEFRSTVSARGSMRELSVEIEPAGGTQNVAELLERVSSALRNTLGFSVDVRCAASNTLPRFEMKAHRFVVS